MEYLQMSGFYIFSFIFFLGEFFSLCYGFHVQNIERLVPRRSGRVKQPTVSYRKAADRTEQKKSLTIKRKDPWNYNLCSRYGPTSWKEFYPECGGSSQSPINIVTSRVDVNNALKLIFDWPFSTPIYTTYEIKNVCNNTEVTTSKTTYGFISRGISLKADLLAVSCRRVICRFIPPRKPYFESAPTLSITDSSAVRLIGVPRNEKEPYCLAQIHFHFSSEDYSGSEHSVDGEKYPAEMHIVYYNRKYRTLKEAENKPDGLSVVGVFLMVGRNPVKEITKYINDFENLKYGSKHKAKWEPMYFLQNERFFYTYQGSLTSPGCHQSVRWIVMKNPQHISQESVQILRSLRDKDGRLLSTDGNCRPIQQNVQQAAPRVEANFMSSIRILQ